MKRGGAMKTVEGDIRSSSQVCVWGERGAKQRATAGDETGEKTEDDDDVGYACFARNACSAVDDVFAVVCEKLLRGAEAR